MTSMMRLLSMASVLGATIVGSAAALAGEPSESAPAPAATAEPATAAQPAPAAEVETRTEPGAPAAPPAPVMKPPAIGAVPEVGSPAIDFTLGSGEGKPTALKDYRGKWVVLYFYPKDFTRGCTLEAQNFQRDLPKYDQLNAVILGVSVDSPQSHKDFCAKEQLTFKLLSDSGAKVSTQYGSVMEYEGAKMSARHTFLISPEGKIAKVYTKVNPAGHSEEVLADLGALQKKERQAKE